MIAQLVADLGERHTLCLFANASIFRSWVIMSSGPSGEFVDRWSFDSLEGHTPRWHLGRNTHPTRCLSDLPPGRWVGRA